MYGPTAAALLPRRVPRRVHAGRGGSVGAPALPPASAASGWRPGPARATSAARRRPSAAGARGSAPDRKAMYMHGARACEGRGHSSRPAGGRESAA